VILFKTRRIAPITLSIERAAMERNPSLILENISSIGQVWAVNWQWFYPCTHGLDGGNSRRTLVRRQVIPYHHVVRAKCRHQDALDIRLKGQSIRCPRQGHRRDDPRGTQARYQGDVLPNAWDRRLHAFARRGSTVRPSHGGGGTGFIHENQVFQRHCRHLLAKDTPLLLDARRIPFLGMLGLLLAGDEMTPQNTKDGHEAASDTQSVAQFRERGIGLLTYEFEKPRDCLGVQFGTGTAAVCFGLNGSSAAETLEQTHNRRDIDAEKFGQGT
jgi:hypothetical protein